MARNERAWQERCAAFPCPEQPVPPHGGRWWPGMNPPSDTARERNRVKRAVLDSAPARRPTAEEMKAAREALGIKTPLEHWAEKMRSRKARPSRGKVSIVCTEQPSVNTVARAYPALAYKPSFARR